MIWLAMTLALTAAQDGPVPYTAAAPTSQELYAGPPVRPYEPAWNTPAAEGDAYVAGRRELERPVLLGGYAGAYEAAPTDEEVVYQQGVASAEIRADSLMGGLDGRWRVTGPDDRVLLELLMIDRGDGALVEGAWREPTADPATPASRRLGALSLVVRAASELTIETDDPEGSLRLRLERDGAGWRGVMERGGGAIPVAMAPAA